MDFAIGIDIGGGSTKIGLVSADGTVIDRRRIPLARSRDDNAPRIIALYADAIRDLTSTHPRAKPCGIGIGFPGPVNPDHLSGTLGNIPALDDIPLAAMIGEQFGLPARMENDATAAGLAEAQFGRDRDAGRLLLIAAGTGIGVAFTVGGKPFVTSGGCLGDAGHLIVRADDVRRCRQGCLGCLESLASGDALNGTAARYCADRPESALAGRAHRLGRKVDASDVIACAKDGDPASMEMLNEVGRWLGRGAATWAHIFAPNVILLGGGLSAAGDLILGPLEEEARNCGLDMYLGHVRFSLASLGNDAGMMGAAAQIFAIT
ncbi:ROK family protein [Rhizobium sp. CC-YZS058]|uniref:ROK family protein n=1 Tax=Rhizobium sp. CC-YZS058 TaxID=3042153 RepID=UPI002B05DA3D|nr:ROK family protein [Rhizobium sp. CC-YZS058]MEA3537004.1 ROK family protein [Rhizobium sp. CC-YZS058]